MPLRIFNTLTRKKETFVPISPGEVKMYVCGITPYDFCHIGHARAALAFDVIRNYMEFLGYKVTMVRNFTDIDDKIIAKSKSVGLSWREVADRFVSEYYHDMDALGLKVATFEPKATDHIPEMIEVVRALEAKGYAYNLEGDVYFEVRRFASYGKLSSRNLDEMLAGARVEVDPRKKDPLDFALWKRAKEGEPSWESPWGAGRPGWHIECSAMAMKYLGETIDIHGGGADLIFPHHENEIAQSESYTGAKFARYWLHNGFVSIDSEKMSKSLGNFFTIREVLEKYDPEALRLFLLSTHYRAPVDFSDRKLLEAEKALDRAQITLEKAERAPSGGGGDVSAMGLNEALRKTEQVFVESMDDDFHTPKAIASLFEMIRQVNGHMEKGTDPASLAQVARRIRDLAGILGLLQNRRDIHSMGVVETKAVSWEQYQEARQRLESSPEGIPSSGVEEIKTVLLWRAEARKRGEWSTSDEIREWLRRAGVAVEDTREGFYWKYKST